MKKTLSLVLVAGCLVGSVWAQEGASHEGAPVASAGASGATAPTGSRAAAQPAGSFDMSGNMPSPAGGLSTVATSLNYVLRAGDLLRIEVFNEPNLTKESRVAGDGMVVLPLIGAVKIGGFTVGDATQLLRELYGKDYLVNPELTLLIMQYGSRLVYVHGQTLRGSTPVQMPPEGKFTLTQAISAAGGITLRASSSVIIKREKPDGSFERIRANVKQIYTNPDYADVPLQENDVIFVDESFL